MLDVSVLIVNYNTADLIAHCLDSVLKQSNVSYEIIVVDNQSKDASLSVLETFGEQVQVIANPKNLGFGRANNQAYKQSKGRYLFLLNPDANLTKQDDLYQLVKFMDAHPEYGLTGTRIINKKNGVETTAFGHYPRQKQTTLDFSKLPGKLAAVLGASMFIRRDIFEKINGFDEDYFLYAEETDLCLRIRKAGYQIGYCEKVSVKHIGSASERGNPSTEVIRKKKHGKYLFYCKHYPAKDVIAIATHDLRAARRKLWPLHFIRFTIGLSATQAESYARYKLSYDVAKQLLQSL